jgi:hypothetical protein
MPEGQIPSAIRCQQPKKRVSANARQDTGKGQSQIENNTRTFKQGKAAEAASRLPPYFLMRTDVGPKKSGESCTISVHEMTCKRRSKFCSSKGRSIWNSSLAASLATAWGANGGLGYVAIGWAYFGPASCTWLRLGYDDWFAVRASQSDDR